MRQIVPLGGLRHTTTAPESSYLLGALIGGMDLDLSGATLPPAGVTITKISFVGGLHVRVPAGARVELSGFNVIGRRTVRTTASRADGPVVRVRAYGAWGGVRIED